MLTCFVVTVSVVLYFLLFVYFQIFCFNLFLFVGCIFGVVKTVTKRGNIGSGLLPVFVFLNSVLISTFSIGTTRAGKARRIPLLFFSWIPTLLLCPSILTDIKCNSSVLNSSVNTFRCGNTKTPLQRKINLYIRLTGEKSIKGQGKNDSVFININIYWV